MAYCGRCKKFMLFKPASGYCRACEILMKCMTANQRVVFTLRNDFAELFPSIQKVCRFIERDDGYFDSEYNTELESPISLKRDGEFIRSSKEYAAIALTHKVFTPAMARCWFKALAAAGDLTDAIAVLDYAIGKMKNGWAKNTLVEDRNSIIQLINNNNISGLIGHLVELSGNQSHTLRREDIWYSSNDEFSNAILAHINDITENFLLDKRIVRIIGDAQFIYNPIKSLSYQTQDNVFKPISFGQEFSVIGHLYIRFKGELFVCTMNKPREERSSKFLVGYNGRILDKKDEEIFFQILDAMGAFK